MLQRRLFLCATQPLRKACAPLAASGRRLLSTAAQPAVADAEERQWESDFLDATADILGTASHTDSAESMRSLVRKGLLSATDIRDRPDRFFKAHRLLARHAVEHGPGFWIRFTVHYNLCFGTVLAVGGPEQVAAITETEAAGELGCFALTERLAGVQSGLLVETTAVYDEASEEFVLHTPNEGAAKNWISQGFTADKAVVLADLTVGGKRRGPHAFLMDLRRGGELAPGVSLGDMGVKTTGNDLDNAWIAFDNVRLPRAALLNAHASVDASGEYAQHTAGIAPFEMIGQRLYSGRIAVAQASLAYRRKLYEVTREYTDTKPIWSPLGGEPKLSGIPQLRALFDEAEETASALEAFVNRCEEKLQPLLRAGEVPDAALAHAIAVAKVKGVEGSIDLCWRLKQEVGSYALMGSSGFKHLDFLSCCKFAEGDSRVLMLKMARDVMRQAKKSNGEGLDTEELRLVKELGAAVAPAKGDKALEARLWDENWKLVYSLAEATMAKTQIEFMA